MSQVTTTFSTTHVLKIGRLTSWALRVTLPPRFMPNRLKNRISDFLRLDRLNDRLAA